jgi:L-threonylcarbamoyladenylate synthase
MELNKIVKIIKAGGVVIFPTDTVWGIGVSIDRPQAIKRLYQIKKREKNKATAVLTADLKMARKYGYFNHRAVKLAEKYWPGGLTLIVKAKKTVPRLIRGNNNSVGLRQPNHKFLLALLKCLNCGLVASSANFSGQPPPQKIKNLNKILVNLADYLIEGEAGGDQPSTVIDTTVKPFKVIRQGEVKISTTNF